MARVLGRAEFPYDWSWFRRLNVRRGSKILDFGCGSGDLLYYLRANGFRDLVGVDPIGIAPDETRGLLFSRTLRPEWHGRFDLVMLHHCLEHLSDPFTQLKELLAYCKAAGALLVRIPVAGSYAAREYRADWVQLDAPRHLVLPSENGMRSLADRLGVELIHIVYDSTAFQFIGSEQYRENIPMYDPQRSWMLGKNSPFDAAARHQLEVRAAELNSRGDGDQAAFYFRVPR